MPVRNRFCKWTEMGLNWILALTTAPSATLVPWPVKPVLCNPTPRKTQAGGLYFHTVAMPVHSARAMNAPMPAHKGLSQ